MARLGAKYAVQEAPETSPMAPSMCEVLPPKFTPWPNAYIGYLKQMFFIPFSFVVFCSYLSFTKTSRMACAISEVSLDHVSFVVGPTHHNTCTSIIITSLAELSTGVNSASHRYYHIG
jgi:hypothetical protein